MFIILISFFISLFFYIFFSSKNFNINYFYLLKFLIFNIILIIYYGCYLIIYSIFFILKNYWFFRSYFISVELAFYYYKKKSIYFLFWRYLAIYTFSMISLFNYFIINFIIIQSKNFYYINNIYLFLCIYLKTKFYLKKIFIQKGLNLLYKFYIFCIYHFFYFINIDEIFILISKFRLNIFKVFDYIKDPYLNRNLDLNLLNKYYNNALFLKNIFIIKIIYYNILKKYILYFIIYYLYKLQMYLNFKNYNIIQLISNLYKLNKIKNVRNVIKLCNLIIFYINIIIVNIIYNIILYLIYFIYAFIMCIKKIKKIILFSLFFFICIKYYWLILYYFFLLYKHYFSYFPLFNVKETVRFFNFEFIDLRNYFNLIFLHNSLVPLIELSKNNIIYNDLWNNLNKSLSVYGFKANIQYDMQLYSLYNVQNKDTRLLNEVFNYYNKGQSKTLLKWYKQMKDRLFEKTSDFFKYHKKKTKKTKKSHTLKETFLKTHLKLVKKNTFKFSDPYLILNKESLYRLKYQKEHKFRVFTHQKYFLQKIYSDVRNNTSLFIKINKVPLKAIYLFDRDKYVSMQKKFTLHTEILKIFSIPVKNLKKNAFYNLSLVKKFLNNTYYKLYFGKIYNFENFKDTMQYKYKIPSFQWSAFRWKKRKGRVFFFNFVTQNKILEKQIWHQYYDLMRKRIHKKRYYMTSYIQYKYPFCINENKAIINSLYYNNTLKNYIKIIKKYYYIKGLRKFKIRRSYKILMLKNFILKLFLFRLKNWDKPLYYKQLTLTNNNFWSFFDYMKVDKYYYLKNNNIYLDRDFDLNLYFIKRIRKDYIKLRNNLLRLYTMRFQYQYLEKAHLKHNVYNKKLSKVKKYWRAVSFYKNFKLNWALKLFLSKHRHSSRVLKRILVLSYIFKKRFFAYFIYCDYTINAYNDLYDFQISSYKLRVLNKINNLKRFFHFQKKSITNWSLFKYLNSFSFFYYVKHFLWHSPYSFLFFNKISIKDNIQENEKVMYISIYTYKNKIININDYSIIFNLFLNIIEIKNFWYNEFLDILNKINDYDLYLLLYSDVNFFFDSNNAFSTYYYCSKGVLSSFYLMDIYRLLMNSLFEYYTNFLYKLTRYRYILDIKNYTIFEFCKRYFNIKDFFNHLYFKYRLQIYNHLLYGFYIRKCYKKYFLSKNLYANKLYKKELIPFWFIYDYYIKIFIYFLLNKYYIKQFFIYYWFLKNEFICNNFKVISILYYYNFKFYIKNILNFCNCKSWIYFLKIVRNIIIKLYNFIIINILCFKNKKIVWAYLKAFIKIYKLYIFDFKPFIIISRVKHLNADNLVLFYYLGIQIKNNADIQNIYGYQVLLNFKNLKVKKFLNIINVLKENIKILKYYIKLCLFVDSYKYIILFNSFIKGKILKLIFFNYLMCKVNLLFSFSLNRLLLIKIYFLKLFKFYVNIFFNIKNVLIYFKPNYFYFRKQRGIVHKGKFFKGTFKHTVTYRGIYSFKHLTININLFKNLYLTNINNYLYLLNNVNINNNIFNLFFFIFKYNLISFNILFYIILYIFIFIIFFFYNKKFYNIFFFCDKVNTDTKLYWKTLFNENQNILVQSKEFYLEKKNIYIIDIKKYD